MEQNITHSTVVTNKKFNEMLTEEASKINNEDVVKNIGMAFLFEGKKDYKEAINCYISVLNICKNFTLVHMRLGSLFAEIGKFKEASEAYKNATIIEPNNAEANFFYAEVLAKIGNFKEAFDFYKKSFSQNQKVCSIFGMASVLIKSKQFKEAIPLLEEFIKVEPKNYQALANLGLCYSQIGNPEKAVTYLIHSISIFKTPLTYKIFGDVYKSIGNYSAAIQLYDKSMEFGISDIYFIVRATQAKLLLLTSNYELGFKYYSPVLIQKNINEDSTKIFNKFLVNQKDFSVVNKKKLLVLSTGDATKDIFFARFLDSSFKNKFDCEIIFKCNSDFEEFIKNNMYDSIIDQFVSESNFEDVDFILNIESLPFILDIKNENELRSNIHYFGKARKTKIEKRPKVAVFGPLTDELSKELKTLKGISLKEVKSLENNFSNIKEVMKELEGISFAITYGSNSSSSNLCGAIGINNFVIATQDNWQFGSYGHKNPFCSKHYIYRESITGINGIDFCIETIAKFIKEHHGK